MNYRRFLSIFLLFFVFPLLCLSQEPQPTETPLAPVLPEGFASSFRLHPEMQWTEPRLEKMPQHGLVLEVVRADGTSSGSTLGLVRSKLLSLQRIEHWPIPESFRISTPEHFHDVLFRAKDGVLEVVELEITERDETQFIILKAYPNQELLVDFDPAQVPYWHLPEGFSEAFPIPPFAQVEKVSLETRSDSDLGVSAFEVATMRGVLPGLELKEARNWFLGRLQEEDWPLPSFFFQDDLNVFRHSFIRKKDGERMAVELTMVQDEPGELIRFELLGQPTELARVSDALRKQMEQDEEVAKAAQDPAKLIVDVDPNDPEIDFWEFPRGWAAQFPIHPEMQYISARLHIEDSFGSPWRQAVIEGAFLELSVVEVRDWLLEAVKENGFNPDIVPEEDYGDTFKTKFQRVVGDYKQNIAVHIFMRPDGYVQIVTTAQEDFERGTSMEDVQESLGNE